MDPCRSIAPKAASELEDVQDEDDESSAANLQSQQDLESKLDDADKCSTCSTWDGQIQVVGSAEGMSQAGIVGPAARITVRALPAAADPHTLRLPAPSLQLPIPPSPPSPRPTATKNGQIDEDNHRSRPRDRNRTSEKLYGAAAGHDQGPATGASADSLFSDSP